MGVAAVTVRDSAPPALKIQGLLSLAILLLCAVAPSSMAAPAGAMNTSPSPPPKSPKAPKAPKPPSPPKAPKPPSKSPPPTSPAVSSPPPPSPTSPPGSSGNPIDDCWMRDPNWNSNRQKLAACVQGYGQGAKGGAGGKLYVVNTTADDPINPPPGSLRWGATRDEPLWIVFSGDMVFKLKFELYVNSYKTIDARGASISFIDSECLVVRDVTNVIIHGLSLINCARREGSARIRVSETKVKGPWQAHGHSIAVLTSSNVWIDHCHFDNIQYIEGKHIDVKWASTNVTISNSFFTNKNKVILLGHSDTYTADKILRATIMLNYFGPKLTQRLPRCRFGNFHVLNNYYPNGWAMAAIGGSSAPTILSERNYFVAANMKEVTVRNVEDSVLTETTDWNWKSVGDAFLNGAFFKESGKQPALVPPYKYTAVNALDVPKATKNAGPLATSLLNKIAGKK